MKILDNLEEVGQKLGGNGVVCVILFISTLGFIACMAGLMVIDSRQQEMNMKFAAITSQTK